MIDDLEEVAPNLATDKSLWTRRQTNNMIIRQQKGQVKARKHSGGLRSDPKRADARLRKF